VDYYELRIKIPRPRLSWLRYRVRTLLMLMLLVACAATCWHLRIASHHRQILQNLGQAKANRDAALQRWKRVLASPQPTAVKNAEEMTTRAAYFQHRAEIADLLQQLAAQTD
jgi:hypothetical protein